MIEEQTIESLNKLITSLAKRYAKPSAKTTSAHLSALGFLVKELRKVSGRATSKKEATRQTGPDGYGDPDYYRRMSQPDGS